MKREQAVRALAAGDTFDILVIGGGATGAGIALDAATRKYRTALLEQNDFGAGTSSKSSKLIHGGVRYLANAEFSLVREALRERAYLLKNAPHLVKPQGFVIPTRNLYERIKYRVGLRLYDALAGDLNVDRSRNVSKADLQRQLPGLNSTNYLGAVRYCDAQFDDTRLLWNILQMAQSEGAVISNYCKASAVLKSNGRICGVEAIDKESGEQIKIQAKIVINASGAWSDEISALDDRKGDTSIVASQGTHIVLDRAFFPSDDGLLIPRTRDGRVMFVIPWQGRTVIGTTDEQLPPGTTHATPMAHEIDLILATASEYLTQKPTKQDIRSCFAGIRPLSASGGSTRTAKISREHRIDITHSGLVTVTGGKWTTYRLMAEECLDQVEKSFSLSSRACRTRTLALAEISDNKQFAHYGQHAPCLQQIIAQQPALGENIHPQLPYTKAEVLWAVRNEMAHHLIDVMAHRTRALFLDASAALEAAPTVLEIMQLELAQNDQWASSQLNRFKQQASEFSIESSMSGQ